MVRSVFEEVASREALMKLKIHIMLLIVFVVFAGGAVGQNVRSMAPNGTGLSNERLERITAVMNDHVAKGHIAGAIGLIARRGKVGYFETYGFQDKEAAVSMRKDTIFRMYSMTKPITGVAVMILYEEGKFHLTDPVSKYLPELGNMKVAVVETDPKTGKKTRYTVPAQREITILDLLGIHRELTMLDLKTLTASGSTRSSGRTILIKRLAKWSRRSDRHLLFISPARCGNTDSRWTCWPDWSR